MAAEHSDFNQYRLGTEFQEGYVIHTKSSSVEQPGVEADVEQRWTSGDKIGTGGFGIVLRQEDCRGKLRAVKKLNRDMLDSKKVNFSREVGILAKLKDLTAGKHPRSFVQFLGWYENKDSIFLAMEYIEHGDLSQYLKDFGPKAKFNAREITAQLLKGLVIMHKQNICHRDLKPQNVLVAATSPIWVKITDFGVSKLERNTDLWTNCGTTGYRAPELLGLLPRTQRRKYQRPAAYTNAVDLWSLGSLVHEILTLEIPFLGVLQDDDTESEPPTDNPDWVDEPDIRLMSDYCLGKVEFPVESLERSRVSRSGIDFVKKLLTSNPQLRMSAADALKSPWICLPRLIKFVDEENPGLKLSFFPGDLDEALAKKAGTMVEMLQSHGCPDEIAKDLAILTLYDVVLLIDDSFSMRLCSDDIEKVVSGIVEIYGLARTEGVLSARFFNGRHGSRNVTNTIFLQRCNWTGLSRVGTELHKKILKPFLAGADPRRGKKPLLIIIIFDGQVEGERKGLLEDVMLGAVRYQGGEAVAFQFSQVGTDEDGRKFLHYLSNDLCYPLQKYVGYQAVSPHLSSAKPSKEYWALMAKILLGAIVPQWKRRNLEHPPASEEGERKGTDMLSSKTQEGISTSHPPFTKRSDNTLEFER